MRSNASTGILKLSSLNVDLVHSGRRSEVSLSSVDLGHVKGDKLVISCVVNDGEVGVNRAGLRIDEDRVFFVILIKEIFGVSNLSVVELVGEDQGRSSLGNIGVGSGHNLSSRGSLSEDRDGDDSRFE